MKMIVGLGNPGKKYKDTRHNVGFMFVDKIAKEEKHSFSLEKKFQAEIATMLTGMDKILLVKPQTYMNLSGNAVSRLVEYYQIAIEDIVVVYDDLDLPVGKIRMRYGGSAGGHKGMDHIIQCLQTTEIKRIRIGISQDLRKEASEFVLSPFNKDEKISIDIAVSQAKEILESLLTETFDQTMNRFN